MSASGASQQQVAPCPLCPDSDQILHLAEMAVNAAAKMHRLAGAKIHQRCWQEGPRTGALSSDIRLGRVYPPVCPSWHGVSGSCSD